MRWTRRPALVSLLAAAVAAVLGFVTVAPVGSGSAAPAAVPPLVLPAQVAQSSSTDGMLQAERRRFDCIDRVNVERALASLAPVTYDVRLAQAASSHSAFQAAVAVMTHTGSGGSTIYGRLVASGYPLNAWGENVARGQPDCASVMSAWMNSPSHRNNILNPLFVHIGMGMALAADGTVYWTMDLGRGG